MKLTSKLTLLLFATIVPLNLTSCGGIKIAGKKVPYVSVCGNSVGKCRAQGRGAGYIIYKEGPDISGASKDLDGKPLANLGRLYGDRLEQKRTNASYNYTESSFLKLKKDVDYEVRENILSIDFTSETRKKLDTALKASLKKVNASVEVQAQIRSKFRSALSDKLTVSAKIITYTLNDDILDDLTLYAKTKTHIRKDTPAVFSQIQEYGFPIIRQVRTIHEKIKFSQQSAIQSLIEGAISGTGGSSNLLNAGQAATVVEGVVEKAETLKIKASSTRNTVYSYGFYRAPWMAHPKSLVATE